MEKVKRKKQNKGVIVLLVFIGIIAWSVALGGSDSSPTPEKAETKQQEPPKPKEDTSELNAGVGNNAVAFQITNNEDIDWINCKLKLNSKYEYRPATILKHNNIIVRYDSFTQSDGTRFDYFTTTIKNLYIGDCQNISVLRYAYYTM